MSDQENFSGYIDTGDSEPVEQELTTTPNEEPVYTKPAVRKPKSATPPSAWQETTQVSIIGTFDRLGKYLILTDDGDVFLVPQTTLHNTVKPQAINNVALESAERPYSWDKEIAALYAKPEDIRMALWREGMIAQDDAASKNLKRLLKALFTQGVLPVNKE